MEGIKGNDIGALGEDSIWKGERETFYKAFDELSKALQQMQGQQT